MTVVKSQRQHVMVQSTEDRTSSSFDGALRFTPVAAALIGEQLLDMQHTGNQGETLTFASVSLLRGVICTTSKEASDILQNK